MSLIAEILFFVLLMSGASYAIACGFAKYYPINDTGEFKSPESMGNAIMLRVILYALLTVVVAVALVVLITEYSK